MHTAGLWSIFRGLLDAYTTDIAIAIVYTGSRAEGKGNTNATPNSM